MKLLAIIDYKIGNLKSLQRFFKNLGYETVTTTKKNINKKAEILILPGIGAFPEAMKSLRDNQLVNLIKEKAKNGTPVIGICLGMQLLASKSYEFEKTLGIGLIPGKIKKISNFSFHIGWNIIKKINKSHELLFSETEGFFFNHSYYYEGNDKHIIAISNFKKNIPAIIKKKNVYGIQFHPEKSQEAGKNLMINLLNSFS